MFFSGVVFLVLVFSPFVWGEEFSFPMPTSMGVQVSSDSEETKSTSLNLHFPVLNKALIGLSGELTRQDLDGDEQITRGFNWTLAGHPMRTFGWDVLVGGFNVDQEFENNYVGIRLGYQGDYWNVFLGRRWQNAVFDTIGSSPERVESSARFTQLEIRYFSLSWSVGASAEVGEFEDDIKDINNDLAFLTIPNSALSVVPSFNSYLNQLFFDYYWTRWSLGLILGESQSAATSDRSRLVELQGSYIYNRHHSFNLGLGTAKTIDSDESESPYNFLSLGFTYTF